eukprot:1345735-Prymnesium_polylepis.1
MSAERPKPTATPPIRIAEYCLSCTWAGYRVRPPLGWFESNDGGFQKLRRLSRHSSHHLLTWSLRDLRGFDRE